MPNNILDDELIETTYLFCRRQLPPHEAEDAAQEILVIALQALRQGREIASFYGWYWAMARKRIALHLRLRTQGAVSLEDSGLEASLCEYCDPADLLIAEEEQRRLAYILSRLSAIHREIIVLHYLGGMKLTNIAARLNLPEGTVKRRLFDAKSEIKKGMQTMTNVNQNQASYAPADLQLWGGYAAPNYWDAVNDRMTKQIFVACIHEARSVREIADEIGVAPLYFEEKLAYLCENGFLREMRTGRYRTNFIIYPRPLWYAFRAECSDLYADLGREVTEAILPCFDRICALDFYGNHFPASRLLWVLYVDAAQTMSRQMQEMLSTRFAGKVPESNGRDYRIAGTVLYPDETLPQADRPQRTLSWSNIHHNFRTSGYRHVEYANLFQAPPFPDRDNTLNAGNIDLFMRLYEHPSLPLTLSEEVPAAELIRDGCLERRPDGLYPTMPVISRAIRDEILGILSPALSPIAQRYASSVAALADRILLPHTRHDLLEEYAHWILENATFTAGYLFHYGLKQASILEQPDAPDRSSLGICIIYRK